MFGPEEATMKGSAKPARGCRSVGRSRIASLAAGTLGLAIPVVLLLASAPLSAGVNTWTGGVPAGVTLQDATLVAASASDPYVVYAASDSGIDSGLYRSDDGGRSWTRTASFAAITAIGVHSTDSSIVYLGAQTSDSLAGVFRSQDGGATWTELPIANFNISVTQFVTSAKNPSTIYALASAAIFGSDDSGDHWETVLPPGTAALTPVIAALLIDPTDGTTLYASGEDFDYFGYSYLGPFFGSTTDKGANWTDSSGGLGDSGRVTAIAVDSTDSSNIFVALDRFPAASMFHSRDGGSTWVPAENGLPPGSTIPSLVMDPADSSVLYAATVSGVFRTDNSGALWIPFGQVLNAAIVETLSFNADGRILHAGSNRGAFALERFDGSVDIAAESGQTRLLSWREDRLSVRELNGSGEPFESPQEGPFVGWTATAISDGPDGRSHVLWVNGDGRVGLEIAGPLGGEAAFHFPAMPGWTVADLAASPDGSSTSLLFTESSGAMFIATVDSSGGETPGPSYGPFGGWSAISIAQSPDGSTWVLWRATDGRVSISRHHDRVSDAAFRFAATPGWTAQDLTVATDGRPRLLRVHTDGRASLTTLDEQGLLASEQIHENPGFTPRRISAGPDTATRLLWTSSDGTDEVWSLGLDNTRVSSPLGRPS